MKRKIVYGVLAALISFGLWLYVVTVVNPEWEETYANIPVVLENEEILHSRDLMLMTEETPKVTLKLSGNRADMIHLNSYNITIRADLSRIYSAGEQNLGYSIIYPGDVPSNAFEIISQTPQQITLTVVDRMSKPVDVELNPVGETVPGYTPLIDEAVLDYPSITLKGPADVVGSVVKAQITVDLTGKKETIDQQFDYVLLDENGNVVDSKWIQATPEKINCTLPIQKELDVTLGMDIEESPDLSLQDKNFKVTYYDQATGEEIKSPITIAGSEKQLAVLQTENKLIDNALILGRVDLNQVSGTPVNGGLEIEIKDIDLNNLLAPFEITNRSQINTVRVVIEIPDLTVKTFRVKRIESKNIAYNLSASLKTQYVDVTLRGPEYELKWFTEKNLKLVVDFTGATAATNAQKFLAQVVVSEGKERVVIGNYYVDAVVTQKTA